VSRSDLERIGDALSHVEAIRRHMARGDVAGETVADAVALRLAAAIEALRTVDGALEARLFGDDWAIIWATRNRIAHGYGFIDLAIVRATVESDLPGFEAALREEQDALSSRSGS
jgi:uncharacterized protein with HEPN domain